MGKLLSKSAQLELEGVRKVCSRVGCRWRLTVLDRFMRGGVGKPQQTRHQRLMTTKKLRG
jgi:hypothetical protein